MDVRQVEDSENIYGVLFVFVKALPVSHINFPDKHQFVSLLISNYFITLTNLPFRFTIYNPLPAALVLIP